jgi:polar amino acid transport system substrate-binding protein
MFSRSNRPRNKGLIAALILGAVLAHRVGTAAVLNVCVDQANPTFAMDLRVARAAAKTQGYSVKLVPFVGYGKGGDGLPPSRFAEMAQSECQLIMGFPVDVSHPNLPPNVAATSAYASTGFVLIRRSGSAKRSLSELPNGSEVGIAQLDTYAGLLFGTHPNIVMHVYPKDSLMLADLDAKRITAALAWQPSIEFNERRHPEHPPRNVVVLPGEHMLWNLVALYMPQSQDAANLFDKGLYDLQSKRQLERLIEPYSQAAPAGAAHTSARWPAARLRYAVAWNTNPGRLIKVADASRNTKGKHKKIPALYTEDQATKGALAYYKNCAMCHAPLLDGQSAGYSGPALKGPEFADPSYDFHVSDIFNFVAKLMPAATPGSLTHEQDVEIMAFILQQNGYPSGSNELVYEEAEKSRVPMRYYGK